MTAAADQMELAGAAVAPDPVSAREITVALVTAVYERFAEPEWLCLQQVAIGGRSLDVVAVRMWGRAVINAFEVKATRSDWLREMREPKKADAVIGMCDHFWLVAAKGIVKPEELPEHWGWLVLQPNNKLRSAKAAPSLDTHIPHREFWASLLGLAHRGGVSSSRIERMKQTEYARGRADELRWSEQNRTQQANSDAQDLALARQATKALGWGGLQELVDNAAAIKAALGAGRAEQRIRSLREQAQWVVNRLSEDLGEPRPPS